MGRKREPQRSSKRVLVSTKEEKKCKHCGIGYRATSGRGLCRICHLDEPIRNNYDEIATFGGDLYKYSPKPELKECKHCGKKYSYRGARGLCSPCWRDEDIRKHYHKIATFGGNVHTQMQDFLNPELL